MACDAVASRLVVPRYSDDSGSLTDLASGAPGINSFGPTVTSLTGAVGGAFLSRLDRVPRLPAPGAVSYGSTAPKRPVAPNDPARR